MVKRKIVWSKRATVKFFAILEFYSDRNQSNAYSKKLYKKIKKELGLLCKQPEIGKTTEIESVRGLIIEDFIILYEITPDTIIVHTVWDCKQNPDNLTIK
ncbi:MAG: type II toxin-antitoxin system RelE/ParE family toxin [Bacteroidales bacterium]|nr:type II toxin-antitoxin system RelE/ParE family toxin [Bacteroidales bacterium]